MNNKWKQLINTQSLYSSTLKKKDITFSHFVKKSFHPSKQSFLCLAELTKDECWNWNLHPKLGSFDVCTLRVIRYWRVKRVTNRAKLQSPNRCLHTRTHAHTHIRARQKADRSEREEVESEVAPLQSGWSRCALWGSAKVTTFVGWWGALAREIVPQGL